MYVMENLSMLDETITIPVRRYKELIHAEMQLTELEIAGVNNWEGYEEAMEKYYSHMGEE